MREVPAEVLFEMYTRLDGTIEACKGIQNTGLCQCCVHSTSTDVLHLLPGELEYLKSVGVDITPAFNSNLMARCSYADKHNCTIKPFICRIYPILPIRFSKGSVSVVTIEPGCAYVKRYSFQVALDAFNDHVNKVVDVTNYLVEQVPEIIEWFYTR